MSATDRQEQPAPLDVQLKILREQSAIAANTLQKLQRTGRAHPNYVAHRMWALRSAVRTIEDLVREQDCAQQLRDQLGGDEPSA